MISKISTKPADRTSTLMSNRIPFLGNRIEKVKAPFKKREKS